jgi:isopenicillin-N epimerase
MVLPLKTQFLLNPDIVYLNHGSAGACPRTVFRQYQRWQRELERQPMEFMGRRATGLLAEARGRLGSYVNVPADHLVYFTNPTHAINMVAHSLKLQPGDEILTTDQEYGAMDRMWEFIAHRTGARYIHQRIPLPISTPEDFVKAFWAGVSGRTRVVYLSHVTSPTALTFPVGEICRRAREAGLISIVDGAHAPGQISLDLGAIGADVYAGACHKWLCAPKGSAFLYARPEAQDWLEPLIVSRGWERGQVDNGSALVWFNEGQGTRDLSAFLAVPSAIDFQVRHNWDAQRERCHQLARDTQSRIDALTGLDPICPASREWFTQMVSIRLPEVDLPLLSRRLQERRIEVPVFRWNQQPLMRVSFQAYNDQRDADALVDALSELLH